MRRVQIGHLPVILPVLLNKLLLGLKQYTVSVTGSQWLLRVSPETKYFHIKHSGATYEELQLLHFWYKWNYWGCFHYAQDLLNLQISLQLIHEICKSGVEDPLHVQNVLLTMLSHWGCSQITYFSFFVHMTHPARWLQTFEEQSSQPGGRWFGSLLCCGIYLQRLWFMSVFSRCNILGFWCVESLKMSLCVFPGINSWRVNPWVHLSFISYTAKSSRKKQGYNFLLLLYISSTTIVLYQSLSCLVCRWMPATVWTQGDSFRLPACFLL